MAINILKNEHFHSIGDFKGEPTLEEIKEDVLKRVIEKQPILARGGMDYLIGFIPESDPPKLQWKLDTLRQLSIGHLLSINGVLENRLEFQTRTY